MSVRMRHTRAHSKNRRSHHNVDKPTLSTTEGGALHTRHRVSPVDGTYRGRQVIDMSKKQARVAAKAQKEQG